MSLLDEIININISRDSVSISSSTLSTLLIIGDSKKASSDESFRVKSYGGLLEVVADYANDTDEYKAASLYFGQAIKPTKLLIGQALNNDPFVAAYTKITQINNDFYGVMITSKDSVSILAIAAAVEADTKLFGTSSNDANILISTNTTNIIYKLKNLNRSRSFALYNGGADVSYPEGAMFGLMLSKDAGSATWAYKTLGGVTSDKLTKANRDVITGFNGNYYVPLGEVDITLTGITSKGEYIDIIQGMDWLTANMQTKIANALISSNKIPFTNAGIGIIESMVRNSLNEAAERDIIDSSSIIVTVPDVRNVSAEDRGNRLLNNVNYQARLAGAIHKITIQGTVTV